jgi:hypothetical protein
VPQGRETRLRRLAAARKQAGSAEAARSRALRARVAVCAILRQALIKAGVDPAGVGALRLGEAAMAELAGLGQTLQPPEIDAPDAAGEPGPIDELFAAKMLALTRRWPGRGEPDPAAALADELAGASLAELLARRLI